MVAGFPEGTPLRRAMNFTYNHVAPLQFLRTTYKAGPLLALALAGLGGLAAARAAPWLRARGRALPAVAVAGLAALAAVACWPLVRGQRARLAADLGADPAGLERRGATTWTRRSATTAARSCCRASSTRTTTGAGRSTRSCPRSPSGPWRCATRCRTPTCARSTCCGPSTGSCSSGARCRASSARCWTCCRARTVVAGADDDRAGSGAVAAGRRRRRARPARRARRALGAGAARAARGGHARRRAAAAARARLGPRRARGRWCAWRPTSGATVVDGSADALAGLAAFGALPRDGRIAYAGDRRPPSALRRRGRRGRDLRLQPPARARGRADGAEPRRDAGRRRPVLARRRGARPVPGARHRRPDRGDLRRRALPADAVLARLLAVPRAAAVRGLRRRHGDALAGRPRARGGAPLARDRLRRARATSTRSSCCRTPTGARR